MEACLCDYVENKIPLLNDFNGPAGVEINITSQDSFQPAWSRHPQDGSG
jgi:hypothetical protein